MGVMIVPSLFLLWLLPGALRAQTTTSDHTIRLYQRMLERNSRDARTYYRLGDAYIQKARESGDVTYFTLAEQALRRALDIAPKLGGAVRHLAYVFYSRHEFDEAANHAKKAIDLDPADGDAFGILGDALSELGRYDKAEEAYNKMIQLEENLYSYSRLAGLKSTRGDPSSAMAGLEQAIKAGKTAKRPAESIAWAQWQLGSEYFALGNLNEAEASYLQSLETYPNYYRALAGMAQIRTAQKRYDEAIHFYQKAIAIIPMPEYAAALGDVFAKIGRPDEAKKLYDLVEYIGYLNTLNKVLYNRELAYFYADHDIKLKEGLELAKRELEYRRDIYAYDVLAWNLYKNGKLDEALNAIKEALKLGTKDAKLYFHAGMIYRRMGEREKAEEYLRRALSTNPHFHIFHADLAERTLREIEEQPSSVANSSKGDDH